MSKDLLVLADEYAAATATFARALALKDSADSMSPIARDAGDKRAVLAEALAALDTAQPVQVNEWRAAVTDALVVAHILTTENAIYPRKAVQDVIDWNCQVALDPRVSSKAQALVDSGKSVQVNAVLVSALQAAEKLEHEALVALSEATYELKVGNTYTTATDTYKSNNDLIHRLDKILNSQYRDRKRAALTAAKQAQPDSFQERVALWMLECFGQEIADDADERNHRFLEEALELVQACGCTQSEAHQLVDYVYGRPVGEKGQEVGGVMVTLAALCLAQKLDMHECGETELARIWTKVESIRAKQAAKPKHSPLPEHPAKQAQPERAPLSADAYEALVEDLGEWSRHVVEDTAHITLDTHIRRTLAVHGIKQGGEHD